MDLPAKIAFLINGKNGTSISLNTKIKEVFEGFDIGIFYSSEDERFLTVPKKLLDNGYRVFIILGGDGTVNEVLNGIAQNETHFTIDNEAIWSNIRIGIIPYGTANDFSRNLEDCSLEAIKLNFINGFYSKIDYGIAQYIDKSGALRNRYFLNVLNIGLGGMAAFKATSLKKWWGKLSYMIAVALSFLSYKKKNMTWHIEGHSFTRKIFNLSIANGRYAGNGLAIAPDATINDGRLDITVVGNVTILDYLLQLRNLITCTKIRHKEVSYQSCSTVITFQNEPQERPWDCDGEYIQGELLRVTIDPHSIRLLHHIKR